MSDDSSFLVGRTALVTGGGSGIGKAIADALVTAGATTIYADINLEAVTRAATAAGEFGEAMHFDVSSAQHWEEAITKISQKHGKLDVLVNCAGAYLIAPVADTTFEAWNRVVDTNLGGAFFSLKFAAPLLAKSPDAMVINIASTLGLRGRELMSAYAASKAGVLNLTRSAAREFAHHGMPIRVNAICPGPTDTAILESLDSQALSALGGAAALRDRAIASVPLGRLGEPGEIADTALFLLSERATFITGSCLVVDGGQAA